LPGGFPLSVRIFFPTLFLIQKHPKKDLFYITFEKPKIFLNFFDFFQKKY